jgi:hypothetical protein
MQTTPVDSSVIAEIGYDEDTKVLEVRFHNEHVHQYFSVPRSEYEKLMSARSIWSYFTRVIRVRYRSIRTDISESGLDT